MKVLVRADASAAIGSGHVSRCLTLVERLQQRGAVVTFACAEGSATYAARAHAIPARLVELPHPVAEFDDPARPEWLSVAPEDDAAAVLAAVGEERFDWVVVDHYGLGAPWETAMRAVADRILVISDAADRRHDCDALLDQNLPPGGEEAYRPLVPAHAEVLAGPRFALLRPEFLETPVPARVRTELRRVLVSCGGVDVAGATACALDGLEGVELDAAVDVVVGARHPQREAIDARCARRGWTVHVQTERIAELMRAADIAIGAAGASSWERCWTGLPSLALVVAANQQPIADHLADAGAAIPVGVPSADAATRIRSELASLAGAPERLAAMSRSAAALMRPHRDVADVIIGEARRSA